MKKSRKIAWVVLGVVVLGTCGCASSWFRVSGVDGGPRFSTEYYHATRADFGLAFSSSNEWPGTARWYLRPLFALDLPFSFVLDTVLLPYDIAMWAALAP